MDENKLLPCPFCGGGGSWTYWPNRAGVKKYVIECAGCGAETAPRWTVKEAAALWNRRK